MSRRVEFLSSACERKLSQRENRWCERDKSKDDGLND